MEEEIRVDILSSWPQEHLESDDIQEILKLICNHLDITILMVKENSYATPTFEIEKKGNADGSIGE